MSSLLISYVMVRPDAMIIAFLKSINLLSTCSIELPTKRRIIYFVCSVCFAFSLSCADTPGRSTELTRATRPYFDTFDDLYRVYAPDYLPRRATWAEGTYVEPEGGDEDGIYNYSMQGTRKSSPFLTFVLTDFLILPQESNIMGYL